MNTAVPGSFGDAVAAATARRRLVVQPRMGMSDPRVMREGLLATKHAAATTVGTISVDSYTRLDDLESATLAVLEGVDLNGYPLVTTGTDVTRAVLDGLQTPDFPVQVRHGSPVPQRIVVALIDAGIDATEGGPVSYCLPYGRFPLRDSVRNWAVATETLAAARGQGSRPHLETFGGCMMGQLCPPGLLVALSILEAMFFVQHGIGSVSLSYAQQTDADQDREAIRALRRLAGEYLPEVDWHIVLYAYMGVYPATRSGAEHMLDDATRLAVEEGAARLIVKTSAEAHRIPTVAENVAALERAARTAERCHFGHRPEVEDTGVEREARLFLDAVLSFGHDIGAALILAFAKGHLDIPYCLHPDNAGATRAFIDARGKLRWAATGALPIHRETTEEADLSSRGLLECLSYVRRKYDSAATIGAPGMTPAEPSLS
ncbi:methylaspartate mutase [Amycolatopsis vastitatis]|uniref:Methylaspartate mutase n=1 Tax=Amycolatopsis vastitatis TaxID=1905142 RepID=A0A229SVP1_9PSEU|nr:methylaspartate mutase [Amycolatopsis vastitatis]OXM62830.1 methylaspartate mutase [Amycolatopsis vastitatis]